MKKVLIGHRGTGKTALLERHRVYAPGVPHFDLDAEIEKETGIPLAEYFKKQGEEKFRQAEQSVFAKIAAANSSFVMALGAGFDVARIPADVNVIFVSRMTDAGGRVFLNRPRLEKELSLLEEYKKRFDLRQPAFMAAAHEIYDLPEGLGRPDETEKRILTHGFQVRDAYYTLHARDLVSLDILRRCYSKIELRTDLLDQEKIAELLSLYPENHWLVSVRGKTEIDLQGARLIDRDAEGASGTHQILSSHRDSITEGMARLKGSKAHLKLCPLVESFEDLVLGHEWQQKDPANRSFLPRSSGGRWLWYRQLCKYTQKINFIRNLTRIADQPSLTDWLNLPEIRPAAWAAVLGKPVRHSRSPQEHAAFFKGRGSFFTAIELSPEEMQKHLVFLRDLGLSYAAVTSPLKETADQMADFKTGLGAANTLLLKDRVSAANTDTDGFRKLCEPIPAAAKVAVWGGGGTLQMMKALLPQADFFSSRTGLPRTGKRVDFYDVLVWAAPRASSTSFPPEGLGIGRVLDLNYTENSMGLEFAALRQIPYTSGLEMFKHQALKQQEFWSQHERE